MIGITEKDMQAVVNTYDLNPYYYPTLFPLKENYTMTWKALETQVGLKIAGDLVARGASINKKTREAIARIQGDIPKVAIKRTKDENELNEYEIMVAMTSANPDLRAFGRSVGRRYAILLGRRSGPFGMDCVAVYFVGQSNAY